MSSVASRQRAVQYLSVRGSVSLLDLRDLRVLRINAGGVLRIEVLVG